MVASDATIAPPGAESRASMWDRVKPPIYRGIPYIRIALVVVAMILYRNLRTSGRSQEAIFNDWLLYAIVVLGFYFVFGLAGQFAFSQASIFGLGAYCSAWATHNSDHPLILGPIVALFVCLAVAAIFSLIMQKTEHFYFAVGTLGLQSIIILIVTKWRGFSHGAGGESLNIRPWTIFGSKLITEFQIFKLLVAALAVALVLAAMWERSPLRRESIANRDKPVVTRTLGLPTLRLRITMFMLGSAFAGLAGSLFAHRSGSITPESFGVSLGLYIFLMAILGGLNSMWGALVGSWFYVYATDKIAKSEVSLLDHKLSEFKPIIFGGLLIAVMILLPDGITSLPGKLRRLIRKDPRPIMPSWLAMTLGLAVPRLSGASSDEIQATSTLIGPDAPKPTRGPPILEATDMSVSFGGVRAVDEVSLVLHEREILALIGPNGSGKSTTVNAITGVVSASGHVKVSGSDIRLGHPTAVARAGVLRTYQTPQTYMALSCIENVLLTTTDRRFTGILSSVFLRPLMLKGERRRWREAAQALDRVGLLERAEESAANLSYGQQRLLELARTIAGKPKVILLDEPSAGLNAAETSILAGHLRSLRAEGISLLVIDHKIDFISDLCDRVVVLELGRLVAEGDPHGIWEDERVQNAYLGVTDDDDEDEVS